MFAPGRILPEFSKSSHENTVTAFVGSRLQPGINCCEYVRKFGSVLRLPPVERSHENCH